MKNTTNEVNKIHIVDEAGTAQDIKTIEENKKIVEALVLSGSPLSLISSKLFKITEENEGILEGIVSAKDAISQYYYNIEYSKEELNRYKNITKKNIYIYDVKLEKYAEVGTVEEINIYAKNISFHGVDPNDIVTFKFYNNSLNEHYTHSEEAGTSIKELGETGCISIKNIKYPTVAYEYNLLIELSSYNETYSSIEIKGINVYGGVANVE